MARADLLVELVRAGANGDLPLFRKCVEAVIADERSKHHYVLANQLSELLASSNSPGEQPASSPQLAASSPLYQELEPDCRLEHLILPEAVSAACAELIEEQNRANLLRSHNLEPRHLVLLGGPPGNGKTFLAKAIAGELARPLLVVRYAEVCAAGIGETSARLERLFEQVRNQRCVLLFDNWDVFGEPGDGNTTVGSLLLQLVDAVPSYVLVVVATACQDIEDIVQYAAWRRFHVRLQLPPPTDNQRLLWVQRFEARLGIKLHMDHLAIARRLFGMSFSELEQFGLDIQRRYVLSLPNADVKKIVEDRLRQS